MSDIEKIIEFVIEIEKLKAVLRQTKPVGINRYENSAEHSWHVSLIALMLKDYANERIDISHVVKMLLIHDLGEIGAGDQIVYQPLTDEQQSSETQSLAQTLSILPDKLSAEFIALWEEFEEGVSPDAKFAKAIDRVPPLLHNIYGNGHSWQKHNISKEQVFTVNSEKIAGGSHKLWSTIEKKLHEAIESGALK
ncbi:HD domain-containing protein [Microbulbifer sp. ANSA005]|uniref:HD domain-containing protein n=1 Tax=Microbulbifer sp. ANSA005 TaxID=3243362 RepID=UPI004042617C